MQALTFPNSFTAPPILNTDILPTPLSAPPLRGPPCSPRKSLVLTRSTWQCTSFVLLLSISPLSEEPLKSSEVPADTQVVRPALQRRSKWQRTMFVFLLTFAAQVETSTPPGILADAPVSRSASPLTGRKLMFTLRRMFRSEQRHPLSYCVCLCVCPRPYIFSFKLFFSATTCPIDAKL